MTLRPYSSTLQAAYRDTLGTPGAPEVIDDSSPVIPVAVVAQVNTATTSSFTRITDGTDTALVTTGGALNVAGIATPNAEQSIIQIQGTGNGASQDAYTVTTGKTLYCFGMNFDAGAAASVTYQQYKNDASTLVLQMRTSADGKGMQFSGACPYAVYTSAQIVKVTAANLSKYQIWGVEV